MPSSDREESAENQERPIQDESETAEAVAGDDLDPPIKGFLLHVEEIAAKPTRRAHLDSIMVTPQ
jgi:hypothetical protein